MTDTLMESRFRGKGVRFSLWFQGAVGLCFHLFEGKSRQELKQLAPPHHIHRQGQRDSNSPMLPACFYPFGSAPLLKEWCCLQGAGSPYTNEQSKQPLTHHTHTKPTGQTDLGNPLLRLSSQTNLHRWPLDNEPFQSIPTKRKVLSS